MAEDELRTLLDRLNPDSRPSITELQDPETLRLTVEVDLPMIKRKVEEMKHALSKYVKMRGADVDLMHEGQQAWKSTYSWTDEVMKLVRDTRMSFESKTATRDVTFQPWKPGTGVSVYEFFRKFEEWSSGQLSDAEKAYKLYHNHLDKSLVETFAELTVNKTSYSGMRKFLIGRWGGLLTTVDSYLKAIEKAPAPKGEEDDEGAAKQLRTIHKTLQSLMELEVSKGVPVPGLSDLLGSNAFIQQLFVKLPKFIRRKFCEQMEANDEDLHTVQGLSLIHI